MEEINVGDTVEISSNEDGFLGSYFVAQVIEKIKNKHNTYEYEVEYETLLDDEDENKMYREKVEDYKVRPTPPVVRVAEFDVLDKVDVYDNDGWWVGRVTHKFDHVYTETLFTAVSLAFSTPTSKEKVLGQENHSFFEFPLGVAEFATQKI
ncbi:hypothetical protein ACET3Z_016383 [Daucus carota]